MERYVSTLDSHPKHTQHLAGWALQKPPSETILLANTTHTVGSNSYSSDWSNWVLSYKNLPSCPVCIIGYTYSTSWPDSVWQWTFREGHGKKILIFVKYLSRCMYSKTLYKISTSNSTTFSGDEHSCFFSLQAQAHKLLTWAQRI